MREIKFRGFRSEGSKQGWVYGHLVVPATDRLLGSRITKGAPHIVDENGHAWIVEAESVGQFTGLKDKDGKEIYEGDVVRVLYGGDKAYCHTNPATVVVSEPSWSELEGYSGGGPDFDVTVSELEVIGNVFDNPDLIKP